MRCSVGSRDWQNWTHSRHQCVNLDARANQVTPDTAALAAPAPPALTSRPMPLDIRPVPCLRDNYAWLMRDPETQATAILDPSEADPVFRALEQTGWRL